MIDLHHHLLPGLDDGSKSMENSVAMAKLAVADGITHVVCTPHANGQYVYDPSVNEAKITELRRLLAQENVPLTLGMGCDFHLSYDNIQDAKENPTRYAINGLGYVLVEIPDYGLPRGLTEIFYELQLVGLTPILTHPERNPTLQADMKRIEEWLRGGVLIQVTGDSVRGSMGRSAERIAHLLLANRWVHFLATDAHNTSSRPPRLSEARAIVAKKYGAEYAELLCETNPWAVYQGDALPVQEVPRNLYEDREEKSWFQKLTGKLTGK
ncbi:tyrosine-protein phosphatase [Granulicella arctica]|uniref:protein-tyrosine-phosphatase n=1 Tax=Granulicella arctica TaxID=940613 RepID=A0A7Y9THT2_9BACT|nr:CpsB/CapC family capsule biosynthesis tyrosine phosphatase [Granulicella arctica]NYF80904.1 protein-tyrosine phosphatase [Granulicella arctica]